MSWWWALAPVLPSAAGYVAWKWRAFRRWEREQQDLFFRSLVLPAPDDPRWGCYDHCACIDSVQVLVRGGRLVIDGVDVSGPAADAYVTEVAHYIQERRVDRLRQIAERASSKRISWSES